MSPLDRLVGTNGEDDESEAPLWRSAAAAAADPEVNND